MTWSAGCDDGDRPRPPPAGPSSLSRVNLNTANEKQLMALPGIGEKHARSILASRNARGGRFQRLEDLLDIDGIGPATLDKIRPYVVLE